MVAKMHAEEIAIMPALVRRLLVAQFPQWAELPLTPAEPQGWDNRTFRLGTDLCVRLPSAIGYTPQIEKEHRWLPYLASRLPLPIPTPIALGQPGEGYPWRWSIYRWLAGETSAAARIADRVAFAQDLALFLAGLQSIRASTGPQPGPHSAYRGGPLAFYEAEARRAIVALQDLIDAESVTRVLDAALATRWGHPPVWFHGDVAVNNLLVRAGRLCAVIDFGCAGVGDPACDLVIAWTFFEGESRAAFRATLQRDDATWARARGWALWKALIMLVNDRGDPHKSAELGRIIGAILADRVGNA
ncbi:MAG: aminoglycoside phosphotransferase family protein [Anaerolineales bacterium]|nr:aminoglycoside phosphotransferase family protein [Anaerolineales bacterium]